MNYSGSLVDLRPRGGRKHEPRGLGLFHVRPGGSENPKRSPSLRSRRRKTRSLIALGVVCVCVGVGYGISWLSHLPILSIGSIAIVGAQDVPQDLIRQQVASILEDGSHHLFSRTNIFLYPREAIEKAVEEFFPRITSATISRESLLATAITVTVAEREPFAEWCLPAQAEGTVSAGTDSEQCYVMDDGGFIFAEGGDTPVAFATHYVFKGEIASSSNPIGQTFARAHLPGLVTLLQLLSQAGFDPQGAKISNEQDFSIQLSEGFLIKASFGQDARMLLKNLELVLSSDALKRKQTKLEYIDLRFGNRVYYKLKGEAEIVSSIR